MSFDQNFLHTGGYFRHKKGNMSKPKLNQGFMQIATGEKHNDVFSALISARLNSTEYQVVLLVMRKTWGWKKKEDWISLSQFVQLTGKSKQAIVNASNSLVKKNVLVKKTVPGVKTIYSFNKNFSSWQELTSKDNCTSKENCTSKASFTALVKKTVHTKETLTKEKKVSKEKKTSKKGKYSSIKSLTQTDFESLANKYGTTPSFVADCYDTMVNWQKSRGAKKKDWRATLANWVKRELPKKEELTPDIIRRIKSGDPAQIAGMPEKYLKMAIEQKLIFQEDNK